MATGHLTSFSDSKLSKVLKLKEVKVWALQIYLKLRRGLKGASIKVKVSLI